MIYYIDVFSNMYDFNKELQICGVKGKIYITLSSATNNEFNKIFPESEILVNYESIQNNNIEC